MMIQPETQLDSVSWCIESVQGPVTELEAMWAARDKVQELLLEVSHLAEEGGCRYETLEQRPPEAQVLVDAAGRFEFRGALVPNPLECLGPPGPGPLRTTRRRDGEHVEAGRSDDEQSQAPFQGDACACFDQTGVLLAAFSVRKEETSGYGRGPSSDIRAKRRAVDRRLTVIRLWAYRKWRASLHPLSGYTALHLERHRRLVNVVAWLRRRVGPVQQTIGKPSHFACTETRRTSAGADYSLRE
jgi:hypothetical protein